MTTKAGALRPLYVDYRLLIALVNVALFRVVVRVRRIVGKTCLGIGLGKEATGWILGTRYFYERVCLRVFEKIVKRIAGGPSRRAFVLRVVVGIVPGGIPDLRQCRTPSAEGVLDEVENAAEIVTVSVRTNRRINVAAGNIVDLGVGRGDEQGHAEPVNVIGAV